MEKRENFARKIELEKRLHEQEIRMTEFEQNKRKKREYKSMEMCDDKRYMKELVKNEQKIKEQEENLKKSKLFELKSILNYQIEVKQQLNQKSNKYKTLENNRLDKKSSIQEINSPEIEQKRQQICQLRNSLFQMQKVVNRTWMDGDQQITKNDKIQTQMTNDIDKQTLEKIEKLKQNSEKVIEKIKFKMNEQKNREMINDASAVIYSNKNNTNEVRQKVDCKDCFQKF